MADLYRRSGNAPQAITEYRAIIQSKPSIGPAYIGASKTYLSQNQVDEAIHVLETVSSRNTSYNEVLLELIDLYNHKAVNGDDASLEQAARAIDVLEENGVESRAFYRLLGEFYFTAFKIVQKTRKMPPVTWPDQKIKSQADLSRANEHAWREYLARSDDADHDEIINSRIMAARTWAFM